MTEMITERRARRRGRLAAVLALAATIGALIVLPVTSASALAIDCSYGGPGLFAYVGAGRDGITCQGVGGGGMGSGVGYHSVTEAGSGQTVPSGYCPAGAIPPVIPDDFYDHGLITSYSYYQNDFLEKGSYAMRMAVTEFFRNGAFVGSRQMILNKSNVVTQIIFNDSTLLAAGMQGGPGVVMISSGTCTGGWNVQSSPHTNAAELVPESPMAPPGTAAPTATAHEVVTTGSMSPVPFSSGKYFLRVDVTNIDSVDLGTDIDLDLSAYSVVAVAAMPSDGSCPFATNLDEHCSTQSVAAGGTKTFTFVVQARSGAGAPAHLNVMTSFRGFDRPFDTYEAMEVSRVGYAVPNTP